MRPKSCGAGGGRRERQDQHPNRSPNIPLSCKTSTEIQMYPKKWQILKAKWHGNQHHTLKNGDFMWFLLKTTQLNTFTSFPPTSSTVLHLSFPVAISRRRFSRSSSRWLKEPSEALRFQTERRTRATLGIHTNKQNNMPDAPPLLFPISKTKTN